MGSSLRTNVVQKQREFNQACYVFYPESSESSIKLATSFDNTISGNTITTSRDTAIKFRMSFDNTISGNTITTSDKGRIYLDDSGNNTVRDNTLINTGLDISGNQVETVKQTAVTNNTVNGQPLVYWQNVIGGSIPSGAGQVILVNCTSVTLSDQHLSNAFFGLRAIFSSNIVIANNVIANNVWKGIVLVDTNHTVIDGNTITYTNGSAIHLENSNNCTISNNNIHYNIGDNQISIGGGSNMHIRNNIITYNEVFWGAIFIENWGGVSTSNLFITQNTISHNSGRGILAFGVTNLSISSNSIQNNGYTAVSINYSPHSNVSNNYISGNAWGLYLAESSAGSILDNTLTFNGFGVFVDQNSDNTIISGNSITNSSSGFGIEFGSDCDRNLVEWNNLNDNLGGTSQANDEGSNNLFANNFWDEHDNTDSNGDGIADTPYDIDGSANNQDTTPSATLIITSRPL